MSTFVTHKTGVFNSLCVLLSSSSFFFFFFSFFFFSFLSVLCDLVSSV